MFSDKIEMSLPPRKKTAGGSESGPGDRPFLFSPKSGLSSSE